MSEKTISYFFQSVISPRPGRYLCMKKLGIDVYELLGIDAHESLGIDAYESLGIDAYESLGIDLCRML